MVQAKPVTTDVALLSSDLINYFVVLKVERVHQIEPGAVVCMKLDKGGMYAVWTSLPISPDRHIFASDESTFLRIRIGRFGLEAKPEEGSEEERNSDPVSALGTIPGTGGLDVVEITITNPASEPSTPSNAPVVYFP